MNRKILFRGKRKDNKEWVEGYYVTQSNHACYSYELEYTHFIYRDKFLDFGLGIMEEYEVDSETIDQYTGIDESDGRRLLHKIFENDLCNVYVSALSKNILCQVVYVNGTFYFKSVFSDYYIAPLSQFCNYPNITSNVEVLGNIHDNPELLKNETN